MEASRHMAMEPGRASGARQAGSTVAAATAPANERRVASRTPVDRAVEIRLIDSMGSPEPKTITARLADLSASGVGLRVARPIAPGRQFLLAPPAGANAGGGTVNPL